MASAYARLELKFLDGRRAVAALTVAVHHAYLFTGRTGDAQRDLPAPFRLLELGQYSVAVFIVLSGFVLMLPIAQSPTLTFKRGAGDFIKRRARRLLPPYYAAMLLFTAVVLAVPALRVERGTAWDSKVPITWDGGVAHLLMLHNLNPSWIYQGNGPAWSVATEWQIYLAMVVVLLPLWRRVGPTTAVTVAVIGGLGIHAAAPRFDAAHLWYVADFAFGMLAAVLVVRGARPPRLGLVTASLVALSALAAAAVPGLLGAQKWLFEVLFGVVVATALVWMARRHLDGRRTFVHRVLEARVLVWVGLWSYSLYLIHSPLLGFGNLLLLDVDLSTAQRFAVEALVVLPVAAAIAFGFHLLVERRFMTTHQRSVEQPVIDLRPREVEQPVAP